MKEATRKAMKICTDGNWMISPCLLLTKDAKMGRNMVAVDTLLVNSVKKQIIIVIIRTRTGVGKAESAVNCSAIQSDSPDACVVCKIGYG